MELSLKTRQAISAYKTWALSNDRRDGTDHRNREEERAQARLNFAVQDVPKEEFAEYVRLTDEWEENWQRSHDARPEPR